MEHQLAQELELLIARLRASKPDERSAVARRWAVTLTLLEQAAAYFVLYVVATCEPPLPLPLNGGGALPVKGDPNE